MACPRVSAPTAASLIRVAKPESTGASARRAGWAFEATSERVIGSLRVTTGDPHPDRISTNYVERSNLTMRMGMRRFTRSACTSCTTTSRALTWLSGKRTTSAMAAGVDYHVWTRDEIAALLD